MGITKSAIWLPSQAQRQSDGSIFLVSLLNPYFEAYRGKREASRWLASDKRNKEPLCKVHTFTRGFGKNHYQARQEVVLCCWCVLRGALPS
jgi:hypothetical protein